MQNFVELSGVTTLKKAYLEILERHLSLRGNLTHQYAEKLLKVSPATIRRLFREMAQQHKAVRFHGGLSAIPDNNSGVIAIPQRENRLAEEKELLASQVLSEFSSSGLNMIHGGTTTQRIAKYLVSGTYLTDSVLIAAELSRRYPGGDGPSMLLTGGQLDIKAGFLYGPKALSVIRSYVAEVFVTSVRGVDRQGLLETDDQTVGIMKAMMAASRKTVVIADHLKFQQKGPCRLVGWNEVDLLITSECRENQDDIAFLKRKGIRIELINPITKEGNGS